jgi:cytoskeleton protein RodZ
MEDCRNTRTSANCDPLDGEAKIGRVLKQTRRKRGLSLDEVEQATKIRARYLSGLEREDYAMLPAAVYTQGFLKTYANYLGLDGEALSRQLRSRQLRSRRRPRREGGINYKPPSSDFEQPLISPSGVAGTEKRMVSTSAVVTLLAALLALAALTGPLYLVGRDVHISSAKENTPPAPTAEKAPGGFRQEPQSTVDDARAQAEPDEELVSRTEGATGEGADGAPQAEEPTATGQSAPADTLLVSVTVQARPAWILVRSDGVLAYEETAPPGFTQTFEADSQLSITSGDAGVVTVEVNGQDAGALGSVGEVVTKSFNLKSPS